MKSQLHELSALAVSKVDNVERYQNDKLGTMCVNPKYRYAIK